jgi:hypothetical protein
MDRIFEPPRAASVLGVKWLHTRYGEILPLGERLVHLDLSFERSLLLSVPTFLVGPNPKSE